MGQNPGTLPQNRWWMDGSSPKYRGPPDQILMATARGQMDGFARAELILAGVKWWDER